MGGLWRDPKPQSVIYNIAIITLVKSESQDAGKRVDDYDMEETRKVGSTLTDSDSRYNGSEICGEHMDTCILSSKKQKLELH